MWCIEIFQLANIDTREIYTKPKNIVYVHDMYTKHIEI